MTVKELAENYCSKCSQFNWLQGGGGSDYWGCSVKGEENFSDLGEHDNQVTITGFHKRYNKVKEDENNFDVEYFEKFERPDKCIYSLEILMKEQRDGKEPT